MRPAAPAVRYGRGTKAGLLILGGVLCGVLALGACSRSDVAAGPGGVTVGEKRALDEAAAMLGERRPAAEPSQAKEKVAR